MSDARASEELLDRYWTALAEDRPADVEQLSCDNDDARFIDLLHELNDARLLLREDSTLKAGLSDTQRLVANDTSIDTGTVIDGYQVIRTLGRGGMGVVYAAEQLALGRQVALKLIRTGPLATAEDLGRFEAEASATAGLNHPGIVSVIDSGQWNGHHYFSMHLVDGPTLRDAFADGPIETGRAAGYIREISDAIQHAHENRILHRDIKPSNVILDVESDRPCVTDFGLAKLFEPDSETSTAYEWTKSGAMVGTPSYMSPEQALGQSKYVSPASDVYSIGAILYEAITGRAPFRAATPVETMRQVVDVEPASPRVLNPDVSRDLETICLKCLAKKPESRYQSAGELRDELDRYLAGQPILARPIGNTAKAWRWCQRNPAIAGSFALIGLLILGGGAAHNLRLSREVANTKAAEAEANGNLAQAVAAQKLAERDYDRAAQAVERMLYTLGAVDLEDLPQGEELRMELLEESAALQRQFAEDHPGDVGRVVKLIIAEQRLAEVMYEQGKVAESEVVLKNAIRRIETFAGERNREFNEADLVTRNKLANWFVAQGRYPEAIEVLTALIARTRELTESDLENRSTWLSNLGQNAGNLSILCQDSEQKSRYAQESIAAFKEAIQVDEPLFKDRLGLAVAHCAWSFDLQYSDQEAALDQYDAAMKILEQLSEENPGRVLVRQRLGETHYNMALLFRRMDRTDAAMQAFRKSIAVREQVAADFPNKVIDVSYLAGTYAAVGNTYLALDEFDKALPEYAAATRIVRDLLERHPDCVPAKSTLFGTLMNQGICSLRLDQPDAAIACFDGAESIANALGERLQSINELPLIGISRGEGLCALGNRSAGLAEMKSGIELAIQNATNQPSERLVEQLRSFYLQYASGLGRYEFDTEAQQLIDQIADDKILAASSHHTAAAACGMFCGVRFADPKPADEQLAVWFGTHAIDLLTASVKSGYEPPLPYGDDDSFDVFRSMELFGDVAVLLEQLASDKPLPE